MSTVYFPPRPAGTWKGAVATSGDLPSIGNQLNDTRVVAATNSIYRWNGTAWSQVTGGGGGGGGTSINGYNPSGW